MLDVVYHRVKFGGARISPAAGTVKSVVCLSVTLLNISVCAPDFAMKASATETILIPLDRGRLAVMHPCSSFSDWCQLATPVKADFQKPAKFGFFTAKG